MFKPLVFIIFEFKRSCFFFPLLYVSSKNITLHYVSLYTEFFLQLMSWIKNHVARDSGLKHPLEKNKTTSVHLRSSSIESVLMMCSNHKVAVKAFEYFCDIKGSRTSSARSKSVPKTIPNSSSGLSYLAGHFFLSALKLLPVNRVLVRVADQCSP